MINYNRFKYNLKLSNLNPKSPAMLYNQTTNQTTQGNQLTICNKNCYKILVDQKVIQSHQQKSPKWINSLFLNNYLIISKAI